MNADGEATLRGAGWSPRTFGGVPAWHRGARAAGDRYWPLVVALEIHAAELEAGRTLWPGDPDWPAGVTPNRPDGRRPA